MQIRGIRGAITVDQNTSKQIKDATYEMVNSLINLNSIREDDVISVVFTMTNDLDKIYPSIVLRDSFNWNNTPILNFEEKNIVNSMQRCIRVLIYINTSKSKKDMVHVYLREAKKLRPDLYSK